MPFGKIVQTNVEGVVVEGRMRKSCGDLDVTITRPFHWLSGGSHIMALARGRISFDGEYGDACAKEILNDLYHLGCFVRDHMKMLQWECRQVSKRGVARMLELNLSDFSDDKAALRKRLRSGEIDNKTYQRLFTELLKKKEDCSQERRRAEDQFFEKQFPMVVPRGTRKQVLDILNEPNLLFYGTSTPRGKN